MPVYIKGTDFYRRRPNVLVNTTRDDEEGDLSIYKSLSRRQLFARDYKGAAESKEEHAAGETRYSEQRIFPRPKGEERPRDSNDSLKWSHQKKLKYTISEDLTVDLSKRLKVKYLALQCSQSSNLSR